MHRIQSTVSDAIVLYDSGYISDRRVSSDVPARTLTILGNFEALDHSALHEVLVTQIRPARTETPVRTQAETESLLNPFSLSLSLFQIIFAADSRSLEKKC